MDIEAALDEISDCSSANEDSNFVIDEAAPSTGSTQHSRDEAASEIRGLNHGVPYPGDHQFKASTDTFKTATAKTKTKSHINTGEGPEITTDFDGQWQQPLVEGNERSVFDATNYFPDCNLPAGACASAAPSLITEDAAAKELRERDEEEKLKAKQELTMKDAAQAHRIWDTRKQGI